MSLAHVAHAMRGIRDQGYSIDRIVELTGVHRNSISELLKHERGQKPWRMTSVLKSLMESKDALPWPNGMSPQELYALPDSDLSDLPPSEARLAHATAAMVVDRLANRTRIDVRLYDSA
jgi:hypothetical protein